MAPIDGPFTSGDRELTGFIFERTDGKRCLVYNYACHPTVLNADNRLRTADLPGAVAARLHEFDEVILLNGSCGDISTRFTRKGYGFAELDRFADIEAAAIKQGCGSAKICSSSEIRAHGSDNIKNQGTSPCGRSRKSLAHL